MTSVNCQSETNDTKEEEEEEDKPESSTERKQKGDRREFFSHCHTMQTIYTCTKTKFSVDMLLYVHVENITKCSTNAEEEEEEKTSPFKSHFSLGKIKRTNKQNFRIIR